MFIIIKQLEPSLVTIYSLILQFANVYRKISFQLKLYTQNIEQT